jgi:ATP-dependent Clp protease ATP-binding subunit ClpA
MEEKPEIISFEDENSSLNDNLSNGIIDVPLDKDPSNQILPEYDTSIIDNIDSSISVVKMYSEDLTAKKYVTNPAIARESEIKKMIIVLLTPEKSALLVGHAGIGKTAIVEGLAYLIQRDMVPDALKGYHIIKINSTSLLGKMTVEGREETIVSRLVSELKNMPKTIIFIDEIHTLIGGSNSGPMDLANILKPALDRGDVKAIGATTTQEYNIYIVKDRAFLRRFDRIEVVEPDIDTTVKILFGSLPKIQKQTGVKFKYNDYVVEKMIRAIVEATSEFKRVYGLAAMYPDVSFSVLTQAFSNALFQNKKYVDILDVYNAIKYSKRIYPDSIVKELADFRVKYDDIAKSDNITLPVVRIEEVENKYDSF